MADKALTPGERAARRRRLAEVFGDVLPEQTGDDTAEPQSQPDGDDERLRREVPPHHGTP
jgi:hypothetical protein